MLMHFFYLSFFFYLINVLWALPYDGLAELYKTLKLFVKIASKGFG